MDPIRNFAANRNRVPADVLEREVAEHGGEIAVRSRDGRETIFYAPDFERVCSELDRRHLEMADVVLDPIDHDAIDFRGERPDIADCGPAQGFDTENPEAL